MTTNSNPYDYPGGWRSLVEGVKGSLQRDLIPQHLRDGMNAVRMGKTPWPLVIIGDSGGGKTCAALIMLEAWGCGWYMRQREFIDRVANAMHGRLQSSSGYAISEHEVWAEYRETPIAVVDDIGCSQKALQLAPDVQLSLHHHECMARCLNYREDRPTVFTSNLTPRDILNLYGPTIATRLIDAGTVVSIKGNQRKGQGARVTASEQLFDTNRNQHS